MKFYDREKEIAALQRIEGLSSENAQMTVITGRRRIGKTALVSNAGLKGKVVYFFVGRKSEALLCRELCDILKSTLGKDYGEFSSFSRLFSAIMVLSEEQRFTLILDEFQNFKYVNESIFSDMQNIWDTRKDKSRINLILCGSIYSMMTRIFDDGKEPLYGRATARIRLRPFSTEVLKHILRDFNPDFTSEDLLALYMLTGGVAKYVEQLMIGRAYTKEKMLRSLLDEGSYFIPEGREMLSDEFGKDYSNYFSILSAIADGETSRGNIKSYTGIEPGGFLDKLENSYDVIYRNRPFTAPQNGHNVKYGIKDNFLLFWFRYIYKYRSALEIGNTDFILKKTEADYDTFSGHLLERYFRQKYSETGLYNIVTNSWDRRGLNEIDLIAVNEAERHIVFGEIKRNAKRISIPALEQKAADILAKEPGYSCEFVGLSMEDM